MRILQVSNFFKPLWETGGVTKVCYDISNYLVKTGHEVTVYTTDGYKPQLAIQKNIPIDVDGIRVYYFKNLYKWLVKRVNLTFPYYLPFVLRKQIENYDIIHIHEHRTLSAVIVHYYAKKHGIPYVLQSHGSVLPFFHKQSLKKIFDFFFGYSILKNAAKTIALNEDEVGQYQKMGIDKKNIEIIYNGINLEEYKNVPPKGAFKAAYNVSENEKIILYIGRIHKSKGIDLLVESLPLVLNKIPNTKLIILGPDAGFREELEDLAKKHHIEKNVIFTGFVEKNEKIAALNDADIFVTPSFSGFPMSFLEACVFGLPIVTTFKGDNLNWIHNQVGLVVKYNANELCCAITCILNNNNLKEQFENKAIEMIQNDLSIDAIVHKIEKIYTECIG